jgi:hypothetical protein
MSSRNGEFTTRGFGGASMTMPEVLDRDSYLSLGAECIVSIADVEGDRGEYGGSESVLLGPSRQFHPLPAATLNIAPLIGLTDDSPDARIFVTFGWEF